MPTTYIFEFLNLYIPEDEVYDSAEFDIRIEPIEGVEEFEENRRDEDSEYQTGYYRTARCYIEADEDRAIELAEWLTFLYSFFQNRDVRWDTYFPETSPDEFRRMNTYQLPLDNTNLRFVRAVHESGAVFNPNIGKLVDIALETLDQMDERHRTDILRNISLFLQSEASKFMILKFLFLWIVLEANADRYYNRYMKSQREFLFDDEERDRVQELVLNALDEEFSDDQLNRLEYALRHDYIYEPSSLVKIKKYIEYLDLGFDAAEVDDIVSEGREIRNQIVHSIEEAQLRENNDILVDLRKMVMFVILRELGVEPGWQNRLATPNIFGPDSEYELGS